MTLRLFPDLGPTEIVAGQCPSDPIAVLRVLQHVLPWALVWRGGTYHLKTCMDAVVNSRRYGCSDKCVAVQSAFVWVNETLSRSAEGRARRAI
jgi:hypothetical protein